jgi:hypothetical protein
MAKKNVHRYERRRREQARQERAAQRRARKRAGGQSSGDGPDADIEDIVAGPQERDLASDAEVLAAVERAMNPGAMRKQAGGGRGAPGACRRLFVGNLDFGAGESELSALFTEGGYKVVRATIIKDRETGKPRGFGFVELADPEQAAEAIEKFDGLEFAGRPLRVNPADQRQ